MATSRRKVRSLTDLSAKQILQKVSGSSTIFEASDSYVSSSVVLTASALISTSTISGSGHLTVGGAFIQNNLEVSDNLTVRGTPTIISSDVHILISAAASPNTDFRLIAVNELTSSYTTA